MSPAPARKVRLDAPASVVVKSCCSSVSEITRRAGWSASPFSSKRSLKMQRRHVVIASAFVVLAAGLAIGQSKLQAAAAARMVDAPRFEVDPFWPKPLPNHWILGMAIGVGV